MCENNLKMNNITINTRQAVQSLCETNLIKVLRTQEGVPGLVTRFVPREEVIRMIRDNVVEDVGQESKKKGFGFSLKDQAGDVWFVETKEEI